MRGIPEDWEVVSRKAKHPWLGVLLAICDIYSDVTWTVRQKSTGVMKRVTASSERDAAEKIANGWFDSD
jgi:hypothetical protein